MKLAPFRATSKREQVVDALRAAILRGDLEPGERLREVHLARRLGVSQTPVREALASLAQEGLVVRLAHRGTFVSRLHARELRDLLALRSVLDAYSARLAAERATSEDVELLRSLLDRMREAERQGNLPALTEAHLEFHRTLYELGGNTLLDEIFALIYRRMALALAFAENLFRSDGSEADCHLPLVDAVARHDSEGAEQVARELALGWIDQVELEDENEDSLRSEPDGGQLAGERL